MIYPFQLETVRKGKGNVNVDQNTHPQIATVAVMVTSVFQTVDPANVTSGEQMDTTVRLSTAVVHVNQITLDTIVICVQKGITSSPIAYVRTNHGIYNNYGCLVNFRFI